MKDLLNYFPELTQIQKEQFESLLELYRDWNSKINVISRKDFDNFYLHHVLHSLAIAKTGKIKSGDSVMDVGCGGGFPVVPLAILMPDVNFTAVDSIGKKIKVVDEIISGIGIKNITAINDRVENINQNFDWVISRAVTDLSSFVGWTWNKTKNGILYLKGGDLTEEIAASKKNVEIFNISDWFKEEFFETKKVLHVKKQKSSI